MLGKKMAAVTATAAMATFAFSAQAQTKGGLTCPKGKVEAKSIGAYYVPAKSGLTIFFYKQEVTDDEMDAILANAAKFDAGDKAKGPGVGKDSKYVGYAFKLWTRVDLKPGATANTADVLKSAYFSYVCESSERVVSYDFKEKDVKIKAAFPAISVELKQGGKISVTTKGGWDGDPKDKNRVKVGWDIQGAGKVRVYE
jgi:hypothetical protein